MSTRDVEITPDLILRAYRAGLFPMAETRNGGRLFWLDPEQRGVLPLDGFHLPRSVWRTIRKQVFRVTVNRNFPGVIAACAECTADREDTWINQEIEQLFNQLHQQGDAHSVECWLEDRLVGGLYGVQTNGVFFGESMFSRVTDASKIALTYLVARLRLGGFQLLDTQFVTTHLQRFGAISIPRATYKQRLSAALNADARWNDALTTDAILAEISSLAHS